MGGNEQYSASNVIYANSTYGIYLTGASNNNYFIGNFSYGNGGQGFYCTVADTNNTWVDGAIGYSAAGVATPDVMSEVYLDPSQAADSLIMKNTKVNPTVGISSASFNKAAMSLISYNQDSDTGSVRIWGDYSVSGSTFTVDYSTYLYTSQTLNMKVMKGSELASNFTINSTNDLYAVSQLISIQYDGANWIVTGSSTPGTLCTIPVNSNADCGGSNAQFHLTIGNTTPATGDRADFALIAASNDAGLQKRLLFGPSATAFNNGKSRFVIDSTGGFVIKGDTTTNTPSLIDWIASGSTYYTFTDSGAFTASIATITHTANGGIWLNGSKGISLSTVTFDLAGVPAGTSSSSTYITANIVTSTATFYGLVFNNSASATQLSNINVKGSEASLSWTMMNWSGSIGGAAHTFNDPLNKIHLDRSRAGQSRDIRGLYHQRHAQLGHRQRIDRIRVGCLQYPVRRRHHVFEYHIEQHDQQHDRPGLNPDTTYYFRVGALSSGTTTYGALLSTSTWTNSD